MERKDYTHPELGGEIRTISGYYSFQKENRLSFGDREVLYLTGFASVDSSCCGVGGCVFSYVPGYLLKWHYRTDAGGNTVSLVETIDDEMEKREISRMIRERDLCHQVNFM